jgi:transposase-like protein/DDE family transposase
MEACPFARRQSFGEAHFESVELGDRRRNARLVQLADRMIQHPGGTLPVKCGNPADLKALYRLMNAARVTHEAILKPSRERTFDLVRAHPGTTLFIHDTTELDYTGLLSVDGLGQIGNGGGRGYECHNTLAVAAETGATLGLAGQILLKRRKVPRGEKRSQARDCPDRESRLWKRGSQALPAAPVNQKWVEVADRGADVTEFLDHLDAAGKWYVVRSKQNRKIAVDIDGKRQPLQLHDFARGLPEGGRRAVAVAARPGKPKRTATVRIRWAPLTIVPPRQKRGEERGVPLPVWVVYVQEVDPPAGVEPLEWILLTNVPVIGFDDAGERVDWYSLRWTIEEYHKVLKTGCGIETLQFTTEARLQPAIALLSVVALHLLNLRDVSRRPDAKTRPATDIFPLLFVEVLSLWRYGHRQSLSVHDFFLALARLGGHQNRKHDHPPGWLVLWRGWTKLQAKVEIAPLLTGNRCGQT